MRTAQKDLARLEAQQLLRRLQTRSRKSADKQAEIGFVLPDGSFLVDFSSNDYLGLAQEPQLAEALAQGAREHGAGAAASRLLSGSHRVHAVAEEALAQSKQSQRALLFSSGYAAALGAVSSLCSKGDLILIDRLAHASLIDGAKLSEAQFRPFRHNDCEHLQALLKKARTSLSAEARILVVAESVYSMDGDCAPVARLSELCQEFEALLLLDEAHALGILGPQGRGLAAEAGLAGAAHLLQLGTLSKAAGLQGGFIAASADWIELLINRARSQIYSTAVLPALAAAVPKSLQLLQGAWGEERRQQLQTNFSQLAQSLKQAELNHLQSIQLSEFASAIMPLHIGSEKAALQAAEALLEQGILLPAVRYPTVGKGQARLRLTLSALHREEQIEALVVALRKLSFG